MVSGNYYDSSIIKVENGVRNNLQKNDCPDELISNIKKLDSCWPSASILSICGGAEDPQTGPSAQF